MFPDDLPVRTFRVQVFEEVQNDVDRAAKHFALLNPSDFQTFSQNVTKEMGAWKEADLTSSQNLLSRDEFWCPQEINIFMNSGSEKDIHDSAEQYIRQ